MDSDEARGARRERAGNNETDKDVDVWGFLDHPCADDYHGD